MKQLQNPRGSTIANDDYVGPAGQLTVDIDRWELRLHDGETPGGHRICNLDQLYELFMSKDSEFGQVVFAEDARGILTRIGDRQYALREIHGYNGIEVTTNATDGVDNAAGTSANFWIGLNPDDLATLLLGLASGKLLYAGLSTGTADALQITVPTGWKNDQGSIVAFKAHVDVHDSATMQITVGATAGAVLPLITTSGSNKVGRLIKKNTVVLLMRIDRIDTGNDNDPTGDDDQIVTGYRIINMVIPKELGIEPISGMTATNVQDALAELKGLLGGGGGEDTGNDNSWWNFANFNQTLTLSGGTKYMPLLDGERRLAHGAASGHGAQPGSGSGSSGGGSPAQPNTLTFNGITLGRSPATSGAPTYEFYGIVHREGTKIWLCPLAMVGDKYHTADSKFRVTAKIHVGDVAADATQVKVEGTSSTNSGNWIFSDPGTVAT